MSDRAAANALDRVLTGLCHSMNDRLAGLHGLLYVAWREGSVSEHDYEVMREELERFGALVHAARLLPVTPAEGVEPVLLQDLVGEVAQLLAQTDDITATPSLTGAPPPVRARRSSLRRLLLECASASGALDWSVDGAQLRLRLDAGADGAVCQMYAAAAGGRLEQTAEGAALVLPVLT